MSASQNELEYSLHCAVEGMTELILRGMVTKQELLDKIDEILTKLGY